MATPKNIRSQDIRTRDWLLVRLIQGATKSGPQRDRRKEQDRKACRGQSWRKESA